MQLCIPKTEEKFLKTLGTFITVNKVYKVYSTVCYAALVLLTLFPIEASYCLFTTFAMSLVPRSYLLSGLIWIPLFDTPEDIFEGKKSAGDKKTFKIIQHAKS